MKQISSISQLQTELAAYHSRTIGFVPTMGFLHAGHLSLVHQAVSECDLVVMSIFVNPLQFGPNEDLARYPRDIERDRELAEQAGVDILFTPTVEEMYPRKIQTQVQVSGVTEKLCGASRPGHFEGVATVVSKLFHIVGPNRAYFGLKDAQQVAVIEQMVFDLSFPVTIVPCEIVRDTDGIAKSSRNVYLSAEERTQALILSRSLKQVKEMVEQGALTNQHDVRNFLIEQIELQPLAKIDYVEVLSYPTLTEPRNLFTETILIAVAVYFGNTRLLDNVILNK
ncbi:pantoate--beta-alanine ligase [Risungbinella massiliensis]|uniref:pantoate--beta-alanine ligase n=1 Tax=Risungbinella massiliensis TaxID=1329796 RepID=UPI0005CC2011|nr:pantoate--beta-alanine ligase [Risungbinella massiliensis]